LTPSFIGRSESWVCLHRWLVGAWPRTCPNMFASPGKNQYGGFATDRGAVARVNSVRPSSGWWKSSPLSTATNSSSRPGVPLPPTSPLSRICPRRRGGSPPVDVVAPPRTLTTGLGTDGPELVALYGEVREGAFPPLAIPMSDKVNLHLPYC